MSKIIANTVVEYVHAVSDHAAPKNERQTKTHLEHTKRKSVSKAYWFEIRIFLRRVTRARMERERQNKSIKREQ